MADVRTHSVGEEIKGQFALHGLAREGARRMIASALKQYARSVTEIDEDGDTSPSAAAAFLSATRQHLSEVIRDVACDVRLVRLDDEVAHCEHSLAAPGNTFRRPAHETAAGRLLLALTPSQERPTLAIGNYVAPNGQLLEKELEQIAIQRRAWHVEDHVLSLAMPVFDARGLLGAFELHSETRVISLQHISDLVGPGMLAATACMSKSLGAPAAYWNVASPPEGRERKACPSGAREPQSHRAHCPSGNGSQPLAPLALIIGHFADVTLAGLRQVFGADPSTRVLAVDLDRSELARAAAERTPDIAIVDRSLVHEPNALSNLHEAHPAIGVVVVTDDPCEKDGMRVLASGATCVLLRAVTAQGLLTAVAVAAAGGRLFIGAGGQRIERPILPGLDTLTSRELDVLRLLSTDWRYAAIAHELGITAETVRAHVTSVRAKLGVKRSELIGTPIPN